MIKFLSLASLGFASSLSAASPNGLPIVVRQVTGAVSSIPGIKVLNIGNLILLEGQVTQPSQMERLVRLADAMRDLSVAGQKISVQNLVTFTPEAKDALASRVQSQLAEPGVEARFTNQSLYLEGTVENEYRADRAVEIAKGFLQTIQSGVSVRKVAVPNEGVEVRPGPGFALIDLLRIRPPVKTEK